MPAVVISINQSRHRSEGQQAIHEALMWNERQISMTSKEDMDEHIQRTTRTLVSAGREAIMPPELAPEGYVTQTVRDYHEKTLPNDLNTGTDNNNGSFSNIGHQGTLKESGNRLGYDSTSEAVERKMDRAAERED